MDELQKARQRIDEIDREMAVLFEQRMGAVRRIAEYKGARGLPVRDGAREESILREGAMRVEDEMIREYYVRFLAGNMELSRAYQERILSGMTVAYSGTEGAFAHLAACDLFPSAKKTGYPDFAAAYSAVERGEADAAILPLENSYNGEVGAVTDLIFSGSLYLNAVTDLPVSQDLLILPGAAREGIRKVVSHPQALGQCQSYIREHGYKTEEFENTALAARSVAERRDPTVAAIASAQAASLFGLEIAERNINESPRNTTRFAVLSRTARTPAEDGGQVCSVLLFTVPNTAGALAHAVEAIGRCGFNMRTLRSRPMKELLWQYYFYAEIEGNLYTEQGEYLLAELSACCDRLKCAGTYTRRQTP